MVDVPLREARPVPPNGAEGPIRRFREAFGPFFAGVDPVAFQHELRNEGPATPS